MKIIILKFVEYWELF